MDRLLKVNQDEFNMLIFALVAAREKAAAWDQWQQYNAAIDPDLIDKLLQRLVDDRFVAETLNAESESMALARLAKEDSAAALAAALASQPPQSFREYGAGAQARPPGPSVTSPDLAVSSKHDAAERFRYASKSDYAKLRRVADRLREITARDGTGRQFDGAYDYTVRAVIEALEIGDLFYEFPVNRSNP